MHRGLMIPLGVEGYLCGAFFSQMNNLVGLHKILICENYRWSSYSQVLSQSLFFITPIILDLFVRPDDDWVCKPFSFFTDKKLWLTEERATHKKQHQIFAEKF